MDEKENIFKDENDINIMTKEGWNVSIWDILLYLGALLILGWAFLKAFGVIHSPVWIEMLPYFGAGASLIGGAYKLGKIKSGIEETKSKVDRIINFEDRFKIIENEHKLCMDGKLNIHKN